MDPGTQRGQVGAAAAVVAGLGLVAGRRLWEAGRPVRTLASAVLGRSVTLASVLAGPDAVAALAARGREGGAELQRQARGLLRLLVGEVLAAFLETTDLTALVRRHVDLDAVAAGLDLDAAVARVDLDAAVARVDLDAAVARVDLDAIARRLDVDAVVAGVDLDAIADRLDVDAVAARIDLDAVIARIDLVGLAREVIDAIDLPEIVRHSTGSLTSDTIRGVRIEARQADDAVAGFVDRLLHRPRQAPAGP
ncbi:hypothetical protein [Pseudonocardia zijingensis]|uniref:Uncharacterized protein n=1 Tax=Pseudonocardia zijingensis TaxID=153376 RepID=A0ABN1PXS1_9PSEU